MKREPVNDAGRNQLLGYLMHERQSQEATRDWVMTWLDTWCPVDSKLIERVMAKVRGAERKPATKAKKARRE